jgi:hypothetical protein
MVCCHVNERRSLQSVMGTKATTRGEKKDDTIMGQEPFGPLISTRTKVTSNNKSYT